MRCPGGRVCAILATFLAGCGAPARIGDRLERTGDEISAAGQLIHTGTRVVLWNDPGGYDAYRLHRRFEPERDVPVRAQVRAPLRAPERLARFESFRGGLDDGLARRVRETGWRIEDLRHVIRQVVIHFDACGTSRRCFEVLHDIRGLSCHFMVDVDGTVYQTLDLKEKAWHASEANSASVGIEIAHIGAFATREEAAAWYREDPQGVRIEPPAGEGDAGLPHGSVLRPRRPKPVAGEINGKDLLQYDYTEEQYRALERLLLALCRTFPKIRARVPEGADGRILRRAFATTEDLLRHEGLLGHFHVTTEKVDPGPAFDWGRMLEFLKRNGIRGN